MAPEIATRIDNRYEVLGELGRGGMGIVYKANDLKMDRPVAIKVMTSHAPGRDEYQERFLREAKSIAKMQHPNIVVVHDFGYHAGAPYIAMEYLEGIPLDKVIAARVNLTPLAKVNYIVQVCHALHYAHQLGIIHRDVKPGNIMLLDGGRRVKLLDFGIARAGGASNLSKSGLAMGTTCYMSPEQTQGKKDLDARADIFSAGVVLYELLAGKPPWTGESDYEVMTKIIHDPAPPLAGLSDCPAALESVFELALAKDPKARYDTAEKMAQALSELEVPLKERALEEALAQFEHGDLLRANDLVSQILRVDTRHREAIELRARLQQVAQLQQRSEQVRQLRTAAEEAVGQKRYTEALAAVEQAITIDSANTELFHYRELIRNEVKRREDIRKKLELARHAQEMNDLSTAQELIEKVLEADPTDTQARMMKSSLEQERKRQQQQEIAEEASRALAVRAFPRVKEFIQQLEALAPTFAPLASLKKALVEGEAEEKRRIETENLIRDIRRVLESGDVAQCLLVTEQALARFPGEPRLLRLRTQAEALRDAAERERAIQEQVALVQRLTEKGQNAKALAAAENASKQLGADHRLQALLAQLRPAVERERQAQAEQSILAQANDATYEGDFEFAVKILTAAQVDFPNSKDVAEALRAAQIARAEQAEAIQHERQVQAEQAVLAQARTAMQARDFESAVKVLSAAQTNFPGSKEITNALRAAQSERAQRAAAAKRERQAKAEQAALAQAQESMQAGDFEAALKILTPARFDFPNSQEIANAFQAAQAAIAQKAEVDAQHAREREIAEALDRTLAGEPDPELQVRLAEEAVRRIPGNEAAERALDRVRRRHQQIVSAVERARQFEQAQRYAESIQEWENVGKVWPQCPNLDTQIARLKTAQKAAAAAASVPPSPTPRFSATSIMAAAPATAPSPAPQAAPVQRPPEAPVRPEVVRGTTTPARRKKPPQAPPFQAIAPGKTSTIPSKPLRAVETDRSRPRLRIPDLVESVLRSKKLLLAIATVFVVVIGGTLVFRALRANPKPAPKPPVMESRPVTPILPAVAPSPSMGKLTVRANVEQFDLYVDGVLKPASQGREATIPVLAGNHAITVEKRGYAAASPQQVEIAKDQLSALQFTLNKTEGPIEPEPTYLTITSTAGAKVRINRKDVGIVQADGTFSYKTASGRYTIELSRDGYQPWSKIVAVKTGDRAAVNADLTAIPKPAPIIAFSTSASNVQQGATVQLQWDVQNASQVTIEPAIGPVDSKGSRSVNPTEPITYTLTAKGEGGTQAKNVTITVTAFPKPVITVFTAGAAVIQQGKPGKLIWATQNAIEISISELGSVDPTGEHEVSPSKTTTYILTAKGSGGVEVSKETKITVEAAPVAVTSTPQPPPAATVDPDIKAVLDTIQNRYKDAYETMEIGELKKVWYPMAKNVENALKDSFKAARAIKVRLQCSSNPTISGNSAKCVCSETLVYTLDKERKTLGPNSIDFQLEKTGGVWHVAGKTGK